MRGVGANLPSSYPFIPPLYPLLSLPFLFASLPLLFSRTHRHQITSLETRDHRLPYGETPESLSHLGLIRYRVVSPQTDRQTDRIPIADTRSQQYLPVQLSRVKTTERNEYIVSF